MLIALIVAQTALLSALFVFFYVKRAGSGAATAWEQPGNAQARTTDEPLPAPSPTYLDLLERLAVVEVHTRRIETMTAERLERYESRLAALNTRVQRLRQEFEGGSPEDAEGTEFDQLARQVRDQLTGAPPAPQGIPEGVTRPPMPNGMPLVQSTVSRYRNARG